MELNKAGSLEFTMPPTHHLYNSISKLKTTIHVYNDSNKEMWRGRIIHDEKDFYNRKQVYCEGALSFLLDGIQRPYEYKGSVQRFLEKVLLASQNEQVEDNRKLKYRSIAGNIVEDENELIVRSNSEYVSVFNEITDKLLNKVGGYLKLTFGTGNEFDYTFCYYVNTYGDVSEQVIEFGVNLLDITEYINAENVFTVLIPIGKKEENEDGSEGKRLTVESVNDGKDYIEDATAINIFGRIVRTKVWDDVTVASNLLTKGKKYLQSGIEMAVTLSIKAVDLHLIDVNTETIHLGDYVRVVSVPHGLDKYFLCSKIIFDMQNPDKTEFTFGTGFSAMTDEQISAMKQSNNAYNVADG